MKTSKRVLLLVLALALFFAFAVGSKGGGDDETTTAAVVDGGETEAQGGDNGNSDYEVGEGTAISWATEYDYHYVRVAVPVKNTGSKNLYLESATVDIEDASSGTLVQSLSYVRVYPQIIEPGETAYYYEETTFDGTVGTALKAVPHVQVEEAKNPCTRYPITEEAIKDDTYSGFIVTGRVENTDSEAQDYIYVVINCYDAAGALICQEFTTISSTVQPGEKIGFEINSWADDIKAADIASYDIYAFPYQYNY